MLKHYLAMALVMLIEHDAAAWSADELGELGLALLDRPAPQILSVELDQVKGDKDGLSAMSVSPHELEHREALVIGDDRLAIDQERMARKGRNSRGGEREPACKIMTIASEEANAGSIAPGHDAKAVVLDLVNPIRSGWRTLGRGRQAGLNKGRPTAATHTQHRCQNRDEDALRRVSPFWRGSRRARTKKGEGRRSNNRKQQ